MKQISSLKLNAPNEVSANSVDSAFQRAFTQALQAADNVVVEIKFYDADAKAPSKPAKKPQSAPKPKS